MGFARRKNKLWRIFFWGLERECEEELSVKCRLLNKQPDFVWTGKNSEGFWRIDLCFKIEFESLDFKTSDENIEHGYFDGKEARKLNLAPHLNNLIEILP